MRFIASAIVIVFGLFACDSRDDRVLLQSEINMLGSRHDLAYRGDTLISITYSTFITSSETDTARIDTLIRKDIDSVIYNDDKSISLLRTFSRHSSYGKVHRKFRFNEDNLLSAISRFNGETEYTTDSVVYDYTARKAFYFDLVNKLVHELEYDRDDDITSILERKLSAATMFNLSGKVNLTGQMPQVNPEAETIVQSTYNYFTTSIDPFLINLDDHETLFGCFHRSSIGLFWNGGHRPEFRSVHNIQATKQTRNGEESNALFEYQLKDGLPTARYGGYGVIYYRYKLRK